MTRLEFIEEVNDWADLVRFCWEYDFDSHVEDIYDESSYNEFIDQEIGNWSGSWEDLRDWLYSLPEGYDYYRRDYSGEFSVADDYCFEDYKTAILENADDRGIWDRFYVLDGEIVIQKPRDDQDVLALLEEVG